MKDKWAFAERVYDIVAKIPPGRVTTYGEIARHLGIARSARMVGRVLSMSVHSKQQLPAHRVVNRNGVLTGKHHFETQDTMAQLLEAEGIKVQDDKIVNFEKYFWRIDESL